MDKFLPLPDDEKKKMQPWKSSPVKYPQVTIVRQPCTIPDKSPEETVPEEPQQDEKGGDGDGASASSTETSGEGPSTSSEGAHFSYDKPAKQETDATSDDNKIDEWFDIV
ncbi:hypothetical protein QE152_g359 [Popillia japonica]|uniref:Uncharacterized protein n=1 Tax=Popillia japonica TaxID=7064 RepID=A0AAW1NLU6_POPJA